MLVVKMTQPPSWIFGAKMTKYIVNVTRFLFSEIEKKTNTNHIYTNRRM